MLNCAAGNADIRIETDKKTGRGRGSSPTIDALPLHHGTNGDDGANGHPTLLAEPPHPPSSTAHADLPSVAALSLKDDAVDSPVEQELPDTLAPTAAPPAGAGKRNNLDETAGKPRGASRTDLAYCYPPPPFGDSSSGSLAYPPATPHLTRAPIEIATRDSSVGRGVFATEDIPAGQVIEISPVLVLSQEEYKGRKEGAEDDGVLKGVEASQLRGYVFTWGRDGSMAVALGIGSLFNHSASPNVTYSLDYSQYTISYRTAKPVQRGDELLIFYGHSVRFSHSDAAAPQDAQVEDVETAEDGWGGLGNLDSFDGKLEQADDDRARLAHLKSLTPEQLAERDEEVVGPHEAEFPWRKVTEIIDPEDAELSLMTCYAIDLPARCAGAVFQFVRKHSTRNKNELSHLKRVRPIESSRSSSPVEQDRPSDNAEESDGRSSQLSERRRTTRTDPDSCQSILLFPVTSAPSNLVDLLTASPVADILGSTPVPPLYTVEVPAEAAHTEQQAEEWSKVWPVTIVHIREGAKATRKKKGWEKAKLEWVEQQARKVWERAEEAGRQGEHPIACRITDSWSSPFHNSLRPPVSLVTAHDTRLSTGNVLTHAASNAIDAVAYLDLQGGRPPPSAFCPDSAQPPYLLTGLTVFLSHEPCLLCSMSLLHSRIKNLFFIKRAPGAGGCGSLYSVHEDGGLNHRFEVWEWKGGRDGGIGVGAGENLRLDP
ncbi:tRNA-specific adenosine deaminase subunit tad3 [Rhodotorula toruloides]|nr:tRNA-specific adenosine deaminase subunit tad3 [Rhodotorula toruloides]